MSINDLLPKRLRRVKLNLPGELLHTTAATRAEFVVYAESDHFKGGGYLEVSDHCGECLLSEPCDTAQEAQDFLFDAVTPEALA